MSFVPGSAQESGGVTVTAYLMTCTVTGSADSMSQAAVANERGYGRDCVEGTPGNSASWITLDGESPSAITDTYVSWENVADGEHFASSGMNPIGEGYTFTVAGEDISFWNTYYKHEAGPRYYDVYVRLVTCEVNWSDPTIVPGMIEDGLQNSSTCYAGWPDGFSATLDGEPGGIYQNIPNTAVWGGIFDGDHTLVMAWGSTSTTYVITVNGGDAETSMVLYLPVGAPAPTEEPGLIATEPVVDDQPETPVDEPVVAETPDAGEEVTVTPTAASGVVTSLPNTGSGGTSHDARIGWMLVAMMSALLGLLARTSRRRA